MIPDGTAKRDALRLTKKKAKSLPRVTAYATATFVAAGCPNVIKLTEIFIDHTAFLSL